MTIDAYKSYTLTGSPTWNDVLQAAEDYLNPPAPWAGDNCTGFVWAVAYAVGAPFFESASQASQIGFDGIIVPDPAPPGGYVVPVRSNINYGTSFNLYNSAALNAVYAVADPLPGSQWHIVAGDPSTNFSVIDNSSTATEPQPGDLFRGVAVDAATQTCVMHSGIVQSYSYSPTGSTLTLISNWGETGTITSRTFHLIDSPSQAIPGYGPYIFDKKWAFYRLNNSPASVGFEVTPLTQTVADGGTLSFQISITNPSWSTQPGGYLIYYRTNDTASSAAINGVDYQGYPTGAPLLFTPSGPSSYVVDIPTLLNPMFGVNTKYVELDLYDYQMNYLTGSSTVGSITPPTAFTPDLVIDSVSTDTTAALGGGLDLATEIGNNSSVPAGPFDVSVYLSPDEYYDSNAVLLAHFSITGVAANASVPWGESVLLPSWITSPGQYYVIVYANQSQSMVESSYVNDSYSVPFTVTPPITPPSVAVPISPTVIYTLADLQNMGANVGGWYVLGADIDASATAGWNNGAGFTPIGWFTGILDGGGHTISNLTIAGSSQYVGLFGEISNTGVVRNLRLDNVLIGGSRNVGAVAGINHGVINEVSVMGTVYASAAYADYIGGIAGENDGAISASSMDGSVVGGVFDIGGLVGLNDTAAQNAGTITASHSTATVSSSEAAASGLGGLVGENDGSIQLSYATGSVTGVQDVGGLVGFNAAGTISQSFAIGPVSGQSWIGGLAGENDSSATQYGSISQSYALGSVAGTSYLGGLLGGQYGYANQTYAAGAVSQSPSSGGLIGYGGLVPSYYDISTTNSYWDVALSGQITSAGGVGLTTQNLTSGILPTGFDPNAWSAAPGLYPTVWWENEAKPIIPIASLADLENINLNLSGDYILVNNIDASAAPPSLSTFTPIGNLANPFTGSFNGNGYVIENLIVSAGTTDTGLFGSIGPGGSVSGLGLINESVANIIVSAVGGLAGYNFGTVAQSYVDGQIVGGQSASVGGLIGVSDGDVTQSYAQVSVRDVSGSAASGGLVGSNAGAISETYAAGPVETAPDFQLVALASIRAGDQTYATFVSGNCAYTADYGGGLRIFDISSLQDPQLVGSFNGSAPPNSASVDDVIVSGGLAYVSDFNSGLHIVDVSSPTSPTEVGSYLEAPSGPTSLALSGRYIFINDQSGGAVHVVDISDPTAPAAVADYTTNLVEPHGIAVAGSYLFVTDFVGSLFIVNVNNPTNPSPVASYSSGLNSPNSVCVSGNLAYVADLVTGLHILDVSNPALPVEVGTYDQAGDRFSDVQVVGGYAYLSDYRGFLTVLDVSNPTSPQFVLSRYVGGVGHSVSVSNTAALMSDDANGLAIFSSGLSAVQGGGLVGADLSGSTASSYWDTNTTAEAASAGGTGLTTAQLQSGALPVGFDPTVWGASAGVYPSLDLLQIACFARGTGIATIDGEVAVENLAVGDVVRTADGRSAPIRWIGHRSIDVARHPRPDTVRPVRICRDALGAATPHCDLLISPDHAIFVDSVLVPARLLINGSTIYQDGSISAVHYFHVELDQHSILLANGAPTESYLDTGNRGIFENAYLPTILHPNLADGREQQRRVAGSCAPFATNPEYIEPIWRRLAGRAEDLGHATPNLITTNDPQLKLVADGREFRPISSASGRYIFALPRASGGFRLTSRSAAPSATKPWLDDRRELGVMVQRNVCRRGEDVDDIPVDHPWLASGWWEVERDDTTIWRWTDGDATVALMARDPFVVEIHVAGTMPYPVAQGASSGQPLAPSFDPIPMTA